MIQRINADRMWSKAQFAAKLVLVSLVVCGIYSWAGAQDEDDAQITPLQPLRTHEVKAVVTAVNQGFALYFEKQAKGPNQ